MPRLKTIAFTIAGGLLGSIVYAFLNGDTDGKLREWEYRLAEWRSGRVNRTGPAGG
jgi:hypothetical protein